MDPIATVTARFHESAQLKLASVAALAPAIARAGALLAACLRGGGKLLVCGNGGSAADAQHFSAELLGATSASAPACRRLPCTRTRPP